MIEGDILESDLPPWEGASAQRRRECCALNADRLVRGADHWIEQRGHW